MISIASLMSLSRTGSFNVGSGVTINDLGGVAAFSPTTARLSNVDDFNSHSFSNSTFHTDLSELTAKLQSLERRQIDPLVESPIKANGNFSDYSSELDNSKITLNSSKNQDSLSSTVDDMLTKPLIPTFDKTIPNSTELKPISTQSRYDLLLWCQLVTKSYDNIQIVDLTTSFQNGLAFCAILHHFFPDRIDYNSLSSENPLQNCRLAFDVASKLGVPRVLDPSEVVSKSRSPDLLSMMTYLHQIRTFCCERTKNNDENSPCTNDNLVLNGIFEQCIKTNNSETNHSLQKIENPPDENSNNAKNNLTNPDKAVRSTPKKKIPLMNYEHMLAKARSLLQQSRLNYLAPTSRPGALPPLAHPRKPHPISGSLTAIHSVDENFNRNPVTEESLTNITLTDGQNHRLTDTKLCTSTICIPNVDTSLNSISKPFRFSTSNIFPTLSKPPQSTVDTRFSPEQMKVRRLRLSQMNLFASGRGSGAPVPIRIGEHHLDNKMDNRTQVSTSIKNQGTLVNNSSSNALLSVSNYISNEQAELEEAQKKLDKEAAVLEQRLRQQMAYEPGTALEEELLRRWFILVNKKNALIHRGFQLSIMEKEDDLKKKMKMLQDELRSILSVEDYLKTDNDRRREDLLLQDLVRLVNERDDIIQELDLHEKVLAEELELEQNAGYMSYGRRRIDKSCVLQ
ncbi:unnamed protein product [Schistosoma bovis]|nr:unnamed protein product [Schistosoma bovis]